MSSTPVAERKPQGSTRRLLLEKVTGPHHGYFFGGYARTTADGCHAYVKIFEHRPSSVWEGDAMLKVTAHSPDSQNLALALAEARALQHVKQWSEIRRKLGG